MQIVPRSKKGARQGNGTTMKVCDIFVQQAGACVLYTTNTCNSIKHKNRTRHLYNCPFILHGMAIYKLECYWLVDFMVSFGKWIRFCLLMVDYNLNDL